MKDGKRIKELMYDVVVLKNMEGKFLGNVNCRIIPRIGESITVSSTTYEVKNVVYNISWERINSVDVYITQINA